MSIPVPSIEEWDGLGEKSISELRRLGLSEWRLFDEEIVMLFPGEWYPLIPKGLPITYIDSESDFFEPGKTDNDTRFGYLAFGVLVKNYQ